MIYIIRHGQTDLNNRQILQGRSNYSLNEEGQKQAEEAASRLKDIHFDWVYSSPLKRAIETAEIVSPNTLIHIDQRLIEMDYGPYEGMDLDHLAPEVLTFFADFIHNPAPDGMEQLSSVVARAGAFLQDCCRKEGNILISTHAIAMKGLLEYLTPSSKGSYWSRYIGNCAIYICDVQGGRFTIPVPLP